MLLLLHGLGPCPPQTHAPGVLSLGPGAASLGSMAPAHLAKQGPGAAAQPASTAQARKDTATQRKDLRKQSVSTVRLQNRDGLSRASASDGLELQKQDLTSRCVCVRPGGGRPPPSLQARDGGPPCPHRGHPHRLPEAELLRASGWKCRPGPASDTSGPRGYLQGPPHLGMSPARSPGASVP